MKGIGMAIVVVMLGAASAAAQTGARSADAGQVSQTANLDDLSRRARSASEHADLARRYRERAEALTARAAELDRSARVERPQARSPLAYKWPALNGASQTRESERRVEESRQAAVVAARAAARHHALAVEKGFGTTAEP